MNEELNYINVGMNCVDVSTEETPIIGTTSLGPCVGILLYSPKLKKSVVAHATTDWEYLIPEIFVLLRDNGFLSPELGVQCFEIFETLQKYVLDNPLSNDKFVKDILSYVNKLPNISEEDKIEYLIIPGSMKSQYKVDEKITLVFESLKPIFTKYKKKLTKDSVKRVHVKGDLYCNDFFYDSLNGEFATSQINIKNTPKSKTK